MKILLFHLTGNANVKSAAYGLISAGLLAEFHVSIASIPGGILDRIGTFGPFSEIRRRRFDPVSKPFLRTWPWFEIGRIFALKGGFTTLTHRKAGIFYIDAVVQNLDRHVAKRLKRAKKNEISAVYGYEDTTLFAFREAKQRGFQCLYDLPIGYWRAAYKILEAERERWPEWMATMPGLEASAEKLSRKEEELQLADRIFVASTFTASTLEYFPGKLAKIEVIPYGFPPVSKEIRIYAGFESHRPLKLLFVGSLSQRKGIAYLFEAVKSFGDRVALTLVGSKITNDCPVLNKELSQHCWIPSLPHEQILNLMRESDVLVFPSLFEGFGLVITEAMSQGTPVITTNRTAGPDIIEHGKNGWLIEAGSTEALKECISNILLSPELIKQVGEAAMEKARLRPWASYGKELAAAVGRNN
ncbi:MAG: glycosyltransferase family 4 protein [Ferruginibacter sp.]